jgi:TonB family protein
MPRLLLTLTLLIVLTTSGVLAKSEPSDVVAKARAQMADGDYRKALRTLEKARDKGAATDFAFEVLLAEINFRGGDYRVAISAAERAFGLATDTLAKARAQNIIATALLISFIYQAESQAETATGDLSCGEIFLDNRPLADLARVDEAFKRLRELNPARFISLRLAQLALWRCDFDAAQRYLEQFDIGGPPPADLAELRTHISCFLEGLAPIQKPEGHAEVPVGQRVRAEPIFRPKALYDARALHRNIQGDVTVAAVIDESGVPRCAMVVRGVVAELDRAALEAFAQWRFEPAKIGDRPVESFFRFTLEFEIVRQ